MRRISAPFGPAQPGREARLTAAWLLVSLGLVSLGGAGPALASEVEVEESPQASAGYVERASITTAVIEREPQDDVEVLTNDHVQVFFFTELRDLEGQTVLHRWQLGGELVAEVPIAVGGPRWRAYSSKSLAPEWLGEWEVSAVDGGGRVLATRRFRTVEAAAGVEP